VNKQREIFAFLFVILYNYLIIGSDKVDKLNIVGKGFKRWIKKLWHLISLPEMTILPGQLAFFLVLSLIPIISLIGIIGPFFSLNIATLTDFVSDSFPSDISNVIVPIITGKGLDINMTFFLVFSFIIASNGAYSIIVTSNMLYGQDDNKGVLKRRIKSVFLTMLIVILFIFVLLVPAFGGKIFNVLRENEIIVSDLKDSIYYLYVIIKWPLSLFLVYFFIKLIYTIAPDKQIKSKTVTTGALATATLWILITNIYSYYVANLAHYDIFYGSLSNVIILMFWVYLLSFTFVLGMALNVSYQKKEKIDNIKETKK
jgi:membrane protein